MVFARYARDSAAGIRSLSYLSPSSASPSPPLLAISLPKSFTTHNDILSFNAFSIDTRSDLLHTQLQIYTEAPPSTSPPGQPQAKILPDLCEDRDKLIPRNFTAWDLGLKYEIRLTPGNSCDTGSLKALSKKGNYDNLHVWYGPHLFLDIPTEIRRFEKQQMGRCKNVKKPKGVLCWLPIDG